MNNDRKAAVEWARSLLEQDFLVLDTETTGLKGDAQIVQLAVIDSSGAVLLDTLVKPTCSIPIAAWKIHGITDDMVADAPTFEHVLERLLEIIGNRTLIIYNADFDLRMLRQSSKAAGITYKSSEMRAECAMQWYSQFVGNYRYQRLPGGDHSALGDARATLAVIKKMAADL